MPSALDTPQGTSALAESLLPQLGNRWLHTQAVAARAQEAAAAVPEADRGLLVAAAWLHDIGYAPELRDTGSIPSTAPVTWRRLVRRRVWLPITPGPCTRQSSAGCPQSWSSLRAGGLPGPRCADLRRHDDRSCRGVFRLRHPD
ncbi:HD domain-containing protein [Streptomyces sennicomposti]|uniref:HD domain-containing protein n=1 Tax=Streptomyces sennicomposti TaxID=2873384 RepID=UPI001FFD8A84